MSNAFGEPLAYSIDDVVYHSDAHEQSFLPPDLPW
jgi:hypothetical protein